MNVDTFLEQFGHLADAPGGIKKLRELILDLAVRGKLVEQDSNDEPAEKLLEKIKSNKQRMIESGEIKKGKEYPGKDQLSYNDLPSNWTQTTLFNIVRLISGSNPKNAELRTNGELAYLKVSDLSIAGNEGFITVSKQYLRETHNFSNFVFPLGSILFPKRGGAIATNRKIILKCKAMADPNIMAMAPIAPLDSDYLYVWFLGLDLWLLNSGTSVPQINNKDIYPLSIPLPPLAEQKRIVAKVDELMALCDELETQQQQRQTVHGQLTTASLHQLTTAETPRQLTKAWQRIDTQFDQLFTTKESIKQLRQTILQLAVQGKLVEQDETSPLEQLSELLEENSLNGYSKKPDINPVGTQILRISAATSRSDAIVDEADYRYVKLTEKEKAKFGLQRGDLLACRFNGNLHYVARFAIYQGYSKGLQIYPDKLIRFRLNLKKAIPEYIRYAMNSRQTRDSIEKMCATTAGNIGISATKLKTIEIPVPAISVQKRIVTKVDQMMTLCDKVERDLINQETDSAKLATAMTSSVLSLN